ncbi:MAG TPA: carbamate kinase [Streptosporangiaceae bacterium]|jgi:carbamate kinase|nr:carbamate kinase [Streptosporangiaceae bacterium]
MTKTAVVALGGNALTRPGQAGTYEEMLASATEMASSINEVIEAGWRVVIVHGNGPQVGNLALQQESTALVPAQPLAVLGAMTQGQLGSLLALAIDRLRGPGSAASLITHVTVDRADPAFLAATKPIGPFFDRDQAQRLAAERGWDIRPDSGHGYRRVVASPQPTGIVEINAIRALVDAGVLVIAAGGGGIPVAAGTGGRPAGGPVRPGGPVLSDEPARTVFPDAVIDKDRAARLLATLIGAQALLLVTAVDRVMLDYGGPRQAGLAAITVEQAARYLAEGQFPPGSMGPKIEAALRFLADGGDLAVITTPALLAETLAGSGPGGGTRIEPSPSRAGHVR